MSNTYIPKFHVGVSVSNIILPPDLPITKQINCQIFLNKSLLFTFVLDKSNRVEQVPIYQISDRLQVVFVEQGTIEPVGCISFIARLFTNFRGQSISPWVTLFDSADDDEYDGDLLEDDDEVPRALINFQVESSEAPETPKLNYLSPTSTNLNPRLDTKLFFPNISHNSQIKGFSSSNPVVSIKTMNSQIEEANQLNADLIMRAESHLLNNLNTSEIPRLTSNESNSSLESNVLKNLNTLSSQISKLTLMTGTEEQQKLDSIPEINSMSSNPLKTNRSMGTFQSKAGNSVEPNSCLSGQGYVSRTNGDEQFYQIKASLASEYEEKIFILNLEIGRLKDMEKSYQKLSENLTATERRLEESEAKSKTQTKQLIEQNKILNTENFELKQKLQFVGSGPCTPRDSIGLTPGINNYEELRGQYDQLNGLYKKEVEKSNDLQAKYQKSIDESRNIQKQLQERVKALEEIKSQLEESSISIRSENQKLTFKLSNTEADLTSQRLVTENYSKELEEYRKNIKFLRDRFEEYNLAKELEVRNLNDDLAALNLQNSRKQEDLEMNQKEIEYLRGELETAKKIRSDDANERNNENNAKMAELETKIKNLIGQFQEQALQFDKLKYENIDLKLKYEESKDLTLNNHELADHLSHLKSDNEKLRLSLSSTQEKLYLTASELVKHTTITINQNKIIAQLNQTIRALEKSLPIHGNGRSPYKTASSTSSDRVAATDRAQSPVLIQGSDKSNKSIQSGNASISNASSSMSSNAPLKSERASIDSRPSNNNSGTHADEIDKKIQDAVSRINPSIIPIKMGEGYYRFGTKRLSVCIIRDSAYIRVLGGFISIDDFLRFYTRIELNKIKQLKSNEIEYTDFWSEHIPNEIKQLVLWEEEPKPVSRAAYCSQSPKISKSKENGQSMNYHLINQANASSNTNGKKEPLHIEISKSNEGYVVRTKSIEHSPRINNMVLGMIEKKKALTEASLNSSNNASAYGITPAAANNVEKVPNLFSNYNTNEENLPGKHKHYGSGGKVSASLEKAHKKSKWKN